MRYSYMHNGSPIGFYELNSFPGCNQVVVSNHAFIDEDLRGQGCGTSMHQQRLAQVKALKYDYVICTVVEGNERQRKILVNNGWSHLDQFLNKETGHIVHLYGRVM